MNRDRLYFAALVAIIAVSLLRVGATHHVFSAVIDEPVHLIAGYDYLTLHSAISEFSHPPLAHVVCAWPLRHFPEPPAMNGYLPGRGNDLLYRNDHYERNLAASRRGNLIFLLLALVCTWWWAVRTFSRGVALLAVALLGSMPPILAHAGVVTTDMVVAATLPLALIALDRWLEQRTPSRAAFLGLAIALGLLSKFSFIIFFPVCALPLLALRLRSIKGIATLGITTMVAAFIVWGAYFFEFKTIAQAEPQTAIAARGTAFGWIAEHVPLPAPMFWAGVRSTKVHNDSGHLSYLFGRISQRGFWYFFPVIFFFKTPIPFLILMIAGTIAIVRARRGVEFVLMPLALMLAVIPSSINIGIRHILPIYPPLCIVAAAGAAALWSAAAKPPLSRAAALILCSWMFIQVALIHPDYLAWFNEAAGSHPEHIAVDSNLDWGQDILRLGKAARRHHLEGGHVFLSTVTSPSLHGFPQDQPLLPFVRTQGWIAVSETALALEPESTSGGFDWLLKHEKPVERVGRSIRLYYVK
jgi:hypothetical protein